MIDFDPWTLDKAIEAAKELGETHGEVAGNSADIAEIRKYESIVDNPYWYNPWPMPDLSGEWADGWTPQRLFEHCDLDELDGDREDAEYEVITAYELEFIVASEEVIKNRMNYS